METLLDLLDAAVARYGDHEALALRADDGSTTSWSYRELDRRSRLAAWRLRALGLRPGDRVLTWAPSSPELPAVYFGAIRAGLILVPLDLRMAPDAIGRIARKADARRLAIGVGRDAPDARDADLADVPTSEVPALTAEPDDSFPDDWEAQVLAWPRPRPEDLFDLIFTSGTTGAPKGVMLAHDNVIASIGAMHRIIPPIRHRIVSLLPLSHLFEQAVALFYALDVGADILYVRTRNPRRIFEAIREHRGTSMVVVPQLLDLFWSGIEREAERTGRRAQLDRTRRIARRLPYPARRLLFRSIHDRMLGRQFRLFVSAGAFLPPALQQAWEDLGVSVIQGYGSTETGFGTCNSLADHPPGTVGRPIPPVEMRIADGGEVQFRGPTLFKGYWRDPATTAAAFTDDGWYRTGDIGRLDPTGHLILMGRTKDIVVLPNGLNVYPEDIENELRTAGLRDAVVVETRPGRIEAVVLAPSIARPPGDADALPPPATAEEAASVRRRVDEAVRVANARLAPHQRVAGWRAWPEEDFPRTHTLKVRRNVVRDWIVIDAPLPVRDAETASAS